MKKSVYNSVALLCALATGGNAAELSFTIGEGAIIADPQTLAVTWRTGPAQADTCAISRPQSTSADVTVLELNASGARWLDKQRALEISLRADGSALLADFVTTQPGSVQWPVIKPDTSASAFLLPIAAGKYVPAGERRWQDHLTTQSPMMMTEGLSMPFIGLQERGKTITWLFDNEFHNDIDFARHSDDLLSASVTHTFTPIASSIPYRLRIELGPDDPLQPARIFRQRLKDEGKLITLSDKAKQTSSVERLIGAAHVYFWGGAPLTTGDVKDWKGLIADLRKERGSTFETTGSIFGALDAAKLSALDELLKAEWTSTYEKREIITLLNEWIERVVDNGSPEVESRSELFRNVCSALCREYPGRFRTPEQWGGVISPRSIGELTSAGIDRLWIGLESWDMGIAHPEGVAAARNAGYLIGPYDSYHSIHKPEQPDTWETAQFDEDLFERGAIVTANGAMKKGFKGVGHLLSPLAAKPYVERRISAIMQNAPFNSWFFDCDAFGQYFDNYAPEFRHTQQQDAAARVARMKWAETQFDLVIGSEGGVSLAVPAIHFAHGIISPPIAWGDPDMYKDKQSPYYLGRYYPPDAPEVFFKQVPLKQDFEFSTFDPRYSIPLYQAAMGDCVAATHHWANPSRKFTNEWKNVRLMELLYGIPPLEHVGDMTLDKWLRDFAPYYKVWSPHHRRVATLPVTRFRWLNDERTVLQTQFGDEVRVTANFRDEPLEGLPAKAVRIENVKDTQVWTYEPK